MLNDEMETKTMQYLKYSDILNGEAEVEFANKSELPHLRNSSRNSISSFSKQFYRQTSQS